MHVRYLLFSLAPYSWLICFILTFPYCVYLKADLTLVRYSILPVLEWTNNDSFSAICFIYENEFDTNVNALCVWLFAILQTSASEKKKSVRLNKGRWMINTLNCENTKEYFLWNQKVTSLTSLSVRWQTYISSCIYRCHCWDALTEISSRQIWIWDRASRTDFIECFWLTLVIHIFFHISIVLKSDFLAQLKLLIDLIEYSIFWDKKISLGKDISVQSGIKCQNYSLYFASVFTD